MTARYQIAVALEPGEDPLVFDVPVTMRPEYAALPKPVKRPKLTLRERKAAAKARARARAQKAARIAKRRAAPMPKKKLVKLADDLHSVYIRAQRDGCEMSGWPHAAKECPGRGLHPAELQCAHGWDRAGMAVRFDPANTYALEPRCHQLYTRNHRGGDAKWHDWMAQRLGEQVYQELRSRSREERHWKAWELVEIIRERLAWIGDLPDTLRKEWAQGRVEQMGARIRRALQNTPQEGA